MVLSRLMGESVEITTPEGRTIRVTLVYSGRDNARIGFEADRDVTILRSEIVRSFDDVRDETDDSKGSNQDDPDLDRIEDRYD